jgi:steroid delta-isomerase-like uncharacterized protein
MPDDVKAVPRRLIEEVYNQGRLDVIEEIIAPGYVGHDPAIPHEIAGPAAERELAAAYRVAFPDLAITIEDQIAEDDRVVTRWTARGTHTGDLWGIAGTGREVRVSGTSVDRIRSGRIVESWVNWDALGLMQQLGGVSVVTDRAA